MTVRNHTVEIVAKSGGMFYPSVCFVVVVDGTTAFTTASVEKDGVFAAATLAEQVADACALAQVAAMGPYDGVHRAWGTPAEIRAKADAVLADEEAHFARSAIEE